MGSTWAIKWFALQGFKNQILLKSCRHFSPPMCDETSLLPVLPPHVSQPLLQGKHCMVESLAPLPALKEGSETETHSSLIKNKFIN